MSRSKSDRRKIAVAIATVSTAAIVSVAYAQQSTAPAAAPSVVRSAPSVAAGQGNPQLEALSAKLVEGVAGVAKEAGVALCYNRVGSMFTWFFTEGPVTNWDSISKSDIAAFAKFFRAMLDAGIYLPASQYEAAFLSASHSEGDVQKTIAAARNSLRSARY